MDNIENTIIEESNLANKSIETSLFELVTQIFNRRKKIVLCSFFFIFTSITFYTLYQRRFNPIYKAGFTILVSDPLSNSNKARGGNFNDTLFEDLALGSTKNDLPTLIELLRSSFFLKPIANQFEIDEKRLKKRIKITPGGDADDFRSRANGILIFSFKSFQPSQDIKLLKALSKSYLERTTAMRQERLSEGLAFLNGQEPMLQNRVNEIQKKLQSLRIDNSLIEPTLAAAEVGDEIIRLKNVLETLETEKNRLISIKSQIKDGTISTLGFKSNIESNFGSNVNRNNNLGLSLGAKEQSLLEELLKVDKELSVAKSKYTPNSNFLKSLEARRDQLKPELIKNQIEIVESALILNESKAKSISIQLNKLKNRFNQKPELLREYQVIQQNLEIAQKNLYGLISVREKFQLELAQSTVPWKIINEPFISEIPIKPNLRREIAGGFFLGILGGFLIGYLRERLDNKYHTEEELSKEIKAPILANIPYINEINSIFQTDKLDLDTSKKKPDNNESYNRFFYEEAFRYLYTSLRFLNTNKKLKKIAITSTIPSEGKSMICVLLSKTLSGMGQKILLIDADMRRPNAHKLLKMDNLFGLSNLLTTDIKSWKKAVRKVKGEKQFDVITAGVIPPDAPRLLGSQRFKDLLSEINLTENYDLIIIDNTPLLSLSDPLLVSENTDGILLVVSMNKVNKVAVKDSYKQLISRQSQISLLGLVTNFVDETDNQYKYYSNYKYNSYRYLYKQYSGNVDDGFKENLNENLLNKIYKSINKNKFTRTLLKNINKFKKWIDT